MINNDDSLIDDRKYFLAKLFVYYIFSNDIKSNLELIDENCCITDDALLIYLECLIDKNIEFEFLDDFVKNNIREILLFLRYQDAYKKRNDYNAIVEKINNMLIKLNTSNDTNAMDFYYDEVLKCNELPHSFEKRIRRGQIELVPEEIREGLTMDFLMLLYLNMSEQDYNECFDGNINNEYVIASLRRMIDENPNMFLDQVVYERTIEIIQTNLSYVLNYFYNHQFYKNNIKVYKKLKKIKRDK